MVYSFFMIPGLLQLFVFKRRVSKSRVQVVLGFRISVVAGVGFRFCGSFCMYAFCFGREAETRWWGEVYTIIDP